MLTWTSLHHMSLKEIRVRLDAIKKISLEDMTVALATERSELQAAERAILYLYR